MPKLRHLPSSAKQGTYPGCLEAGALELGCHQRMCHVTSVGRSQVALVSVTAGLPRTRWPNLVSPGRRGEFHEDPTPRETDGGRRVDFLCYAPQAPSNTSDMNPGGRTELQAELHQLSASVINAQRRRQPVRERGHVGCQSVPT